MAIHNEIRKLCYTPQQLFELVAQVERYPEFLPLWHSAHISQDQQIDSTSKVYVTDQVIQIGPLQKPFRTRTTLKEFHHIHIASSDPLFQQFTIDWYFTPVNFTSDKKSSEIELAEKQGGCEIKLSLNCVASSILLRPVFDLALMDTAQSIVSAFENRARLMYEHK